MAGDIGGTKTYLAIFSSKACTHSPLAQDQDFLRSTLPKIQRIRQMIDHINVHSELEVDGGIDAVTAPYSAATGASVFVAGSSILGDGAGVSIAMDRLRAATVENAVLTLRVCFTPGKKA